MGTVFDQLQERRTDERGAWTQRLFELLSKSDQATQDELIEADDLTKKLGWSLVMLRTVAAFAIQYRRFEATDLAYLRTRFQPLFGTGSEFVEPGGWSYPFWETINQEERKRKRGNCFGGYPV